MRTIPAKFPMVVSALTAAILLASCGGGEKQPPPNAVPTTPSVESAAPAGPQTPDPGGKIITVQLMTDETGNYFKPKEIEAHQGDVVRFTVGMGVHNVDFLPDSNAGKTGLPKASDMLQLPGQTFDVKVTFAPGKYYFQCTPHAALGMHGHLEVEKK
jgi:plastocyanin